MGGQMEGSIWLTEHAEARRLGATESATLALKREDGGKIQVTSLLWESPR
jgi:hypothetical protein